MNISLDAVKSYCRVDGEEEDALLLSLVDAAKDYLEGAGVMEPEAEEPPLPVGGQSAGPSLL